VVGGSGLEEVAGGRWWRVGVLLCSSLHVSWWMETHSGVEDSSSILLDTPLLLDTRCVRVLVLTPRHVPAVSAHVSGRQLMCRQGMSLLS